MIELTPVVRAVVVTVATPFVSVSVPSEVLPLKN